MRSLVSYSAALIALAALTPPAPAQAENDVATPTAASVPRLADGHPDLNGIWQAVGGADNDLEDHAADRYAPGGQTVVEEGKVPYLPAALKAGQWPCRTAQEVPQRAQPDHRHAKL